MAEPTEDTQSIVARLNTLEAQYTNVHAAFVAHPTPAKRYRTLGMPTNRQSKNAGTRA